MVQAASDEFERRPVPFPPTVKIRAELAWVTETPDPNRCGCRSVRCCDETRHKPGGFAAGETKFWTFRWEYYCQRCREYVVFWRTVVAPTAVTRAAWRRGRTRLSRILSAIVLLVSV